ncbi:hypothetical protein EBT25_10290 [bacterium]|jgi:hypothetical protein|nr:hypothetical protein [bacterium]
MKVNTQLVLQECIERGVLNALNHVDEVNFEYELIDRIVDEFIDRINYEIDTYFTFDDVIN